MAPSRHIYIAIESGSKDRIDTFSTMPTPESAVQWHEVATAAVGQHRGKHSPETLRHPTNPTMARTYGAGCDCNVRKRVICRAGFCKHVDMKGRYVQSDRITSWEYQAIVSAEMAWHWADHRCKVPWLILVGYHSRNYFKLGDEVLIYPTVKTELELDFVVYTIVRSINHYINYIRLSTYSLISGVSTSKRGTSRVGQIAGPLTSHGGTWSNLKWLPLMCR
jgi:hypothetical protein